MLISRAGYVEVEPESWGRAEKLKSRREKLRWWKKVDEKYEMTLTGLRINPKDTFMPCIFFRFRLVSHTRRRKKISHEEGHGGCPLYPCLFPSLLPPVKVHDTNDSVLNYCWRALCKKALLAKRQEGAKHVAMQAQELTSIMHIPEGHYSTFPWNTKNIQLGLIRKWKVQVPL